MGADERPTVSVFVECGIKRRILKSIGEGGVEHHQGEDRECNSGYDEIFPCGPVRDGPIHRSTATRKTGSPHISREFGHKTQFLGEGEFAWGGIGLVP